MIQNLCVRGDVNASYQEDNHELGLGETDKGIKVRILIQNCLTKVARAGLPPPVHFAVLNVWGFFLDQVIPLTFPRLSGSGRHFHKWPHGTDGHLPIFPPVKVQQQQQ